MKKALVIEDNEDSMELITFILEQNGFTAIRAETGKKGIELALKEKPDFILLDIQLPDMDGIEVLKAIRKSHITAQIPVISVTSYAMSGDEERLIENGCNGYIEKPIDPDTIISEINRLLEIGHEDIDR